MSLLPIEQQYVKNVYEKIADEFDSTRAYHWSKTKEFINQMNPNSLALDVGCGNGRNMMLRSDIDFHGCDITEKFCHICQNKGLDVTQANIIDLPYQNNTYDYVVCSAVIPHLSTHERRKQAVEELVRVTRIGGEIFILVWAFEQTENKKRHFTQQDMMVSWTSKKNGVYNRFYHVFCKGELEGLLPETVEVIESFYDYGNWGVRVKKTS